MRARQGQGDRTLLNIALDYRCGANGSYERAPSDQLRDQKLLQEALRTWEPSSPPYSTFDEAVRTLILAALAEGQANDS